MDLLKLQTKLKSNPQTYEEEFNQQLELYKSLCQMKLKPLKETNEILNFLTFSTKFYENSFPLLLLTHFAEEENPKIKKEIVQCIFRLKTIDLISEVDFFKIILENKQKIPLRRLRTELKKNKPLKEKLEVLNLFLKFLKDGDNFQRPLSAYLIIFMYEFTNEHILIKNIKEIIIDSLFLDSKISKMMILYLLNILDFSDSGDLAEKNTENLKNKKNNKKKNKRMEDKINESNQKEMKLLSRIVHENEEKSKIFSDLEKHEAKKLAKDLFDFIKDSKEDRSIRILRLKIVSMLKIHFNLEIKIYEFVINLIDTSNEDLRIVMSILIDSLHKKEVHKCVKKILNTFCGEYRDDDWIIYGLNLLTEICVKYEFVRDDVKDMIDIFKKHKQKTVFYAYNQCMRAAKYGITDKKEIDFIKRKRIRGIKEENY